MDRFYREKYKVGGKWEYRVELEGKPQRVKERGSFWRNIRCQLIKQPGTRRVEYLTAEEFMDRWWDLTRDKNPRVECQWTLGPYRVLIFVPATRGNGPLSFGNENAV